MTDNSASHLIVTAETSAADVRAANLRSKELFGRARSFLPGGTTRVTVERLPQPIYAARGEGAYLVDVDGARYLDLNNNFTTLINGHAFPPVMLALENQLKNGTCFANPTESEIALAEVICNRVPAVDCIRFVNTGTEAVMFSIKAARAITGRTKIAKFEGAYHGAYDWAEVSQNSSSTNWGEARPQSVAVSSGTPQSVLDEVVVLPGHDLPRALELIEENRQDLACVLIDLLSSRPGLLPFDSDFLQQLRSLTRQCGILVVDDEVLNFRLGFHGAANEFDFEPDLIVLGKIIGGGLPIGAIAGPSDLMAVFAPAGGRPSISQGGTFSANPLSMVAGAASLCQLDKAAFSRLDVLGSRVREGLREVIRARGLAYSVTGRASLFRVHPKHQTPKHYRAAYQSPDEAQHMRSIVVGMRAHGVTMPGAAASCLSTPMTKADIDHIVASFDAVVSKETADAGAN